MLKIATLQVRTMQCFIAIITLFLGGLCTINAQEISYTVQDIPAALRENANAVIRKEVKEIEILGVERQRINYELAVTVFNDIGDKLANALEFYDGTNKIKNQEVLILNAYGKQIAKFRKGEFSDISAVSSNDLYTDNRYSYLDYTPTEYPYTMIYKSQVESSETAFVRPWYPIPGTYVSVMESRYVLKNSKQIPMRFKSSNFEGFTINQNNSEFDLDLTLVNAPAIVSEALAVSFRSYVPEVLVALNDFTLVGVRGHASDWKSFGGWQYLNLIKGLDNLPASTVAEVQSLLQGVSDRKEQIRLIYEYVQNKTRYISVQLGIGGWKPYDAASVNKLGYGDCKGLTNYTKAILKSQGIDAYYTVVWAGQNKRNIDSEFASMQGNHVILNVPLDNEDVWLECTSQTLPFNYLGSFTDDRNVLVITPQGGLIKRTPAYNNNANLQQSIGSFSLTANGDFKGEVTIESLGSRYYNSYDLEQYNQAELKEHYLDYWDAFTNLNLENIDLENNKDEVIFTESVAFSANKYAQIINNKFIFKPNAFNVNNYVPRQYRNRKHDFVIARGYNEIDTYAFTSPKGMDVDYLPEPIILESEFGKYTLTITNNPDKSFTYTRTFNLNQGTYKANKYKAYRDFRKKIKKYDNTKVVFKIE